MGSRPATHPHLSRPEHPACTGTEDRAWTPASLLRAGVGPGPTSSPNPLLLVGRACAGEGGPRLCPQGDPGSTRRTGWKGGLQAQALAASTFPSLPELWVFPCAEPPTWNTPQLLYLLPISQVSAREGASAGPS